MYTTDLALKLDPEFCDLMLPHFPEQAIAGWLNIIRFVSCNRRITFFIFFLISSVQIKVIFECTVRFLSHLILLLLILILLCEIPHRRIDNSWLAFLLQ